MSNISPINAKPPAKTTTPEPSPRLRELFTAGRLYPEDINDALAACPALYDEATDLLPALHRKVEPAGEAVVREVIGARLETFPQPQRSVEGWAGWWADYFDALSDQPAFALEAGMREWVKTDTTGFMPKPGQLLALVKVATEPHWAALNRANRIVKLHTKPEPKPEREPAEVRRAQIAEIMAGLKPASAFSESTEGHSTPGLTPND